MTGLSSSGYPHLFATFLLFHITTAFTHLALGPRSAECFHQNHLFCNTHLSLQNVSKAVAARRTVRLFTISGEDDNNPIHDVSTEVPLIENNASAKSVVPVSSLLATGQVGSPEADETPPYPIDLPSPILLAASIVLAIVSTGSFFEFTGGPPKSSFGTNAAVAIAGFPTCLFLFYAAIQKGIVETEEDDREYNKPRRL